MEIFKCQNYPLMKINHPCMKVASIAGPAEQGELLGLVLVVFVTGLHSAYLELIHFIQSQLYVLLALQQKSSLVFQIDLVKTIKMDLFNFSAICQKRMMKFSLVFALISITLTSSRVLKKDLDLRKIYENINADMETKLRSSIGCKFTGHMWKPKHES